MKIAYHSYLLETICDDVSLRRVYTEPGSAYRISNSYNFDFDVNVSLSRLREQADTFSDYILSQKGYQTRALQDRNIREDQKRLSGAYIYSYLKVIFYSYAHSRYSIKFTSSSSLVFGGHKVLYDCVRRRNINDYSSQNDAMSSVSIEISRTD